MTTILLIAFLLQITPLDPMHPAIEVPLTKLEQRKLEQAPFYKFDERREAEEALIKLHQPTNQLKAMWKPCQAGYHGHIYRPQDIIYVWEVPKCGK